MTPRQAFGLGARARSAATTQLVGYGGALGIRAGAVPYAPSAVSAMTHGGHRLSALISGIRALATLASMGVIRPSETGSGIDIGEITGLGGATMSLGNALPFEFGDTLSFGDSFDIAKTPNNGEPETWYTNPGSGQMRLYGNDGRGYMDLDFDHKRDRLKPHAHNDDGSNRDWAVVPFSLKPY
jgi:hypothetical protein